VLQGNVIIGTPDPRLYPPGNFFPATSAMVGFVDAAGGDYRLTDKSPYHGAATDGTDVGAEMSLPASWPGPPAPGALSRRGGNHE
jgi:hypothetical protein